MIKLPGDDLRDEIRRNRDKEALNPEPLAGIDRSGSSSAPPAEAWRNQGEPRLTEADVHAAMKRAWEDDE